MNENYLRWPGFNQDDLSNLDEPFLQLLISRANNHPKEFAILDTFWDNRQAAIESIGLSNYDGPREFPPLVRIMNAGEDGDIYGALEQPEDQYEFKGMVESGLWAQTFADQLMVNQRRIYNFLEDIVTDIMDKKNEAKYKVDEEHIEKSWQIQVPEPDPDNEDEFREKREDYLTFSRAVLPYTATVNDGGQYAMAIVQRRIDSYEDHLRGLKAHPKIFMQYLLDIREHSHHQVLYSDNRLHPYVSHADLQNLSCTTR